MRRRDFLRSVGTISGLALVAPPAGRATARERDQAQDRLLEIGLGPQLFLDDYMLERIDGLARQVQQPQRLVSPVLDSKSFGTTQPYLTVLRDRDRDRFRIWYNHGPAVWHAESEDGIHWERPWRIFTPDDKDEGLLEFYGMGGMHLRGGLYIGLVRALRDDLPCDPGGPKDGIGYTVLATSRDGVTWQRYREPFLDRNLENGSWDHAMTWMSAALPVGDEVFFYYGGYARGHKIAPTTERQVGLARMKQDRYVALMPIREEGSLQTPSFIVPGNRVTVNAHAAHGEVRVRLLDPDDKPLEALGEAEARPITSDALAAELRWPKPLSALRGKPVCLEFRVRQAALFGFEFHP